MVLRKVEGGKDKKHQGAGGEPKPQKLEMSETIVETVTLKMDVKEDDLQQGWSVIVEEAEGCC